MPEDTGGKKMMSFQKFAYGLSRAGAALACVCVVLICLHILLEIVLRSVFSTSTFVLDEFVGYGVAASTFLALGYALEHGSLIRVGLLVGRLDGKTKRAVEAFCALSTLWITSLLICFMGVTAQRSWTRGRVSSSIAEVPMWIPETVVLVGLAVFWVQLLAYLLRQFTGEAPPVAPNHEADLQSDILG